MIESRINPQSLARRASKGDASPRSGFVLISVLIVIVLLSLAAYQYSELMLAEYRAMDSYTRTAQAKALAKSGVYYTAAILSDPASFSTTLNGNPYDNSTYFQDIVVSDNDVAARRGRFSVLTLRDPNDPQFTSQPYRFGVSDEAGKLNLNALLKLAPTDTVRQAMLLKIPNMTEDVANSILDWLDSSSTIPRTNGAKDEYYPTLTPPYHVKNGPLDSLEELLLVKGVTPQFLYGNDVNRNGVIDADEDPGDGTADLGWQQYLTIYSREPNVDGTGAVRVLLNDPNLATLYTNLQTAVGNDLALFLIAYRLYGGSASMGGAGSTGAVSQDATAQIQKDLAATATSSKNPISSIFTLATQQVTVTIPPPSGSREQPKQIPIPNPLANTSQQENLLPQLFDKTTTKKSSDLTPAINVNRASQTVLSMLPNLQDTDVQSIVTSQPQFASADAADPIYLTPTWLLTRAKLPAKTLSGIESYITTQSQVYRFQVLGYFDGPGPTARAEAVVDTNNGRPRILYYRELAELGKGFTLPKPNAQ